MPQNNLLPAGKVVRENTGDKTFWLALLQKVYGGRAGQVHLV